ncbi:MAG: lysophospholipid acyltransferase family protein [Aeromicrobium sp.]|uniref:lysophospholipid acyltransferase family protein n=1 Tax=Aeromicrobium sp. TaxID=1871063 RepID=UPI0039E35E21
MGRWSGMPRTSRWVVRVLRPWLMLLTKRDWQGAEKLPSGGYVLAPNHLSHLDPLLLSHFMADHGIAPRFLAKSTLFDMPVVGRILAGAEQIPVCRGTGAAAESLRAAVAAVGAGQVVSIYPEGTLTRDPDCWPMTGRTGAVRVALSSGRPLIPLAQWGAQEILWPYGRRLRVLPRKTVHVRVGDPVDLTDFEGRELTEELLHEATERLMDALTALVSDIRGELPSGPRVEVRDVQRKLEDNHPAKEQ